MAIYVPLHVYSFMAQKRALLPSLFILRYIFMHGWFVVYLELYGVCRYYSNASLDFDGIAISDPFNIMVFDSCI